MEEKFLEYLENERRYSAHTVAGYRKDLADFAFFLADTEGMTDLSKADKKMVRNFIAELSAKNIAKRSINRKLSALRSFYLFLLKTGDVQVSPLENIQSLKFHAEKQIPLSVEEMELFRKTVSDDPQVPLLDKIIVETLYQTGMRRAELCSLLAKDVDYSARQLRVTGKGNKLRIVPVSEKLLEMYAEYSETRNPLKGNELYFFLNSRGKKIGEMFVYSLVKKYLSTVTSKQKKSPHILRHSFATHVLDNGAEISKVKKILGHASLASTQVYTNASIEQLKKVFNKAHPRAKK